MIKLGSSFDRKDEKSIKKGETIGTKVGTFGSLVCAFLPQEETFASRVRTFCKKVRAFASFVCTFYIKA